MGPKKLQETCRRIFSRAFAAFHRNELSPPIDDAERLTRYILDSKHYAATKGRVKHAAFLPPPNGRLSVFITGDLDEASIWKTGDDFVAAPRNRPVKARADIAHRVISTIGQGTLTVERDTQPHPLHCNIIGWPDSKDEKIALAQDLAEAATLLISPQNK